MNKTKVAVVGLGGIAQVMHLPSLLKLKEVEISAVCDTEFAKAKNIAVKYGIKKYYKEIDDMLKGCPDLDAVIISAPTNTHKELAIKCLDAGKDVLVEKPLGRDYKEALAIVEAADRNKRQLMVGMNNRFRNDVMMQRSFVRGNETGDVFYVKTGWLKTQSSTQKWFVDRDKSGGGVFLDNGIVMLDIGLWMLGFPEVHSVTSINYSHNTTSVEDSNFTFVKFKNNASLTIEVSWSLLRVQEFFYVNVYGKKGSTSINPLRILKKVDNNLLDMTPKNVKTPLNIEKTGYENEMRHFIGAIRGTHKLLSTGKEALEVMQIVEGVYKSAKSGKEVIF